MELCMTMNPSYPRTLLAVVVLSHLAIPQLLEYKWLVGERGDYHSQKSYPRQSMILIRSPYPLPFTPLAVVVPLFTLLYPFWSISGRCGGQPQPVELPLGLAMHGFS